MSDFKRATTPDDKHQRESAIRDAAIRLMMARGYHALSMNDIAVEAGVAKGTLYLYFKTKETLFLTIFRERAGDWFDEQAAWLRSQHDATAEGLAAHFAAATASRPDLSRLAALTPTIFEHNISVEAIHAFKLWLVGRAMTMGEALEAALGAPAGSGLKAFSRLYALLIGLDSTARPNDVVRALHRQDPRLAVPDFETEMRALLTLVFRDARGGG